MYPQEDIGSEVTVAVSAERDSLKHSMQIIPENQSHTEISEDLSVHIMNYVHTSGMVY
jgi:hypothetical protein